MKPRGACRRDRTELGLVVYSVMVSGGYPTDPSASETLPSEAFSPVAARAHAARTMALSHARAVPAADEAGTRMSQPSLAAELARAGRSDRGESHQRFEVDRVLGSGATGQVYAVRDRDLGRTVAVKILARAQGDDEVGRFVDEARITASLQHPNVLPVYEIAVNEQGEVYFLMKRVEGCSLGEALASSSSQAVSERIAAPNAVVNIVIAVANAIACAHRAGIIHQDIKPDNIMLGEFGETLLVDWGSAVRDPATVPHLYGTPLYMSPEQARREYADARSDIYCLGATLFHTALLRPPIWSDDADEFWRRKRAGDIDEITPDERRRTPAPLLAIALKAMAPDPALRYQSARDLISDLERYQAGLAVTAHRDSWLASLSRWHKRHWRTLWATTAGASVIVVLGALLYGERLKELSSWGLPICSEDFSDGSWKERWQVTCGAAEAHDGRLFVSGKGATQVTYRTPLDGDVAIEFDGEMLPGCYPCDLSLQINPKTPGAPVDLPTLVQQPAYLFQFGAHGNSYSRIMDPIRAQCSFNPVRAEVGRIYRVRVEIAGNHLAMMIDGKTICSYTDTYPFPEGYLSLYSYYPGKAFDRVRIYARGLPQKMPGTAIGDFCAQAGLHEQAIDQYHRIAGGGGAHALTQEAVYKEGLSQYRLHRVDSAFATWAAADSEPWRTLVDVHRIDDAFERGDHVQVL
ncbi:MAG: serine/threonine protein kinase, partial [Planctomycetes bacterium]|nr:serine/threonine protein kinase [Planctomycetota bacterium]